MGSSRFCVLPRWKLQEPTAVRRGQESYDAQNLRRRFFEEVDRYNERDYYDNIYLHKEVIINTLVFQI